MRIVLFYHSLISDWNHGNAHFLRGVVSELLQRGHDLTVYEPADAWSVANLIRCEGRGPIKDFRRAYPQLGSIRYRQRSLDLNKALSGADLVIVHEWNEHDLVKEIGRRRPPSGDCHLLFHDTHHRAVTDPDSMARYDLSNYDGVLAFGSVLRDLYLERGWARRAWTWHEAADTRVFCPMCRSIPEADLVWIGNWGDDERARELGEFLLEPVKSLGLKASVYGVRYPQHALNALRNSGITYRGWLPNYRVPAAFARHQVTVHIRRRPYATALPGIPTIRVFEALACGIPLICAPWRDAEGLFEPGADYLTARDGAEMKRHLSDLLADPDAARELAAHGRATVLARHTCGHRVDQLLDICRELGATPASPYANATAVVKGDRQ